MILIITFATYFSFHFTIMLSFDNTELAYAYKSNAELKKAKFLFSVMHSPLLLKIGLALTPPAIKWNCPFVKPLLRKTIFSQFVGGETLQQTAAVAEKLGNYNVKVILDYGVEGGNNGEAGFDEATEVFKDVINYAASQKNVPFMSIKVTGIARGALLEKLDASIKSRQGSLINRYNNALDALPQNEKDEWQNVVNRLAKICDVATEKKVGVLVDAEETWLQDPVDAVTLLMMDKYNKTLPLIYNTIQLYRHDRLAFLKECHQAALERNFILAIKIVRGAYMEKERERAAEKGYPSPIQPDKQACDNDFNASIKYSLDHLDTISLIVASHNEYSNMLTTQLLDEKKLPHNHPNVHFSQLYGMSDNITFNLAHSNFTVSKYLPFGPVKDVIPYLMRRAQENSSVSGQTGRELSIIHKEMARRKGK